MITTMNSMLAADDRPLPERYRKVTPSQLLRAVAVHPGDWILDVGCGRGYFTAALQSRLRPKGGVLALDIRKDVLWAVRNKLGRKNCWFLAVSADRFPLPDHSVNGAVLAFVLHESPRRKTLLKEVGRVVKPTGWVMLVEWRKTDQDRLTGRYDRIAPEEMRFLLREVGFRDGTIVYQDNRIYQLITHKKRGGLCRDNSGSLFL